MRQIRFKVRANIRQKRRGDFRDRTQLLEHFRNKLLPTFGYRRRLGFRIGSNSNSDAFTNIVSSILEMQQITSILLEVLPRLSSTNDCR